MTNKTKTILCVCALTASAFAWNATADENSLPGYLLTDENGNSDLIIPTEGAYGIYHDPYHGSYLGWNYNGLGYSTYNAKGAWLADRPASDTLYTAIANDSALSFEIERNNTENGFTFGTYTIDNGNIIRQTLGTVTSSTVDENGRIQFKDANGVTQDSVNSGAFNANDMVGVWVQEIGKNIVYYSENERTINENASSLPDLQGESPLFTQGLLGGGLGPDAILYFDDSVLDPANPGMGWSGQDTTAFIKIHIQGVAPASGGGDTGGQVSGGPLPGVWATIALAGAASAYLKRRRKENK